MPALKNERHERFCHEILSDPEGKAGRAYVRAGYADTPAADGSASTLLKNPKVAERLAELKAERSERTEVTLDMVVQGLYAEATRTGNPAGARVQAWSWLGKHAGAFEADNSQRLPKTVTILRENAPRDGAD